MTHPRLECNPARDAQVKFFCVCVGCWLVTLYLPSLHCTWMTNSCPFHIGESHLLPALLCHTKEWRMGTCISVTVRASSRPLSSGGGVMFWVVSHYAPQKALFFFFGCLSHFLYPTRTPPIITVCKWTPVHHLSVHEFDRLSYAILSSFYSINFLCSSEESITIKYCLYLEFGFFHVLMFIKAIRLFPSGKKFSQTWVI